MKRRSSIVRSDLNPLSAEGGASLESEAKIVSLAGCKLIGKGNFRDILDVILTIEDNKNRISYLDKEKDKYLFNSDQLMELMQVTESVKTRIAFIGCICPRLTNPNSRTNDFTDLFSFKDDKSKIEELFKTRADTLKSSQFTAPGGASALSSSAGGRGAGGRGAGRGGAGRGGGGRTGVPKANPTAVPTKIATSIVKIPMISVVKVEKVNIAKDESVEVNDDNNVEKEDDDDDGEEVELSKEDRKKRAEIRLVRAALGLSDNCSGTEIDEFAPVEKWEDAAKKEEEEEEEEIRLSTIEQNMRGTEISANNRTHRSASQTSVPFSNIQQPAETAESIYTQKENNEQKQKEVRRETIATPPSPSVEQSKALTEPKVTPDNTGNRRSKSDIFSPSRVSYSPAGSLTPPPVSTKDGVPFSKTEIAEAHKCAVILNLEPNYFMNAKREEAISQDSSGADLFSYYELLRRKFTKDYIGLEPHLLEKSLVDEEFKRVFDVDKDGFYKLASWKQESKKRNSFLF